MGEKVGEGKTLMSRLNNLPAIQQQHLTRYHTSTELYLALLNPTNNSA